MIQIIFSLLLTIIIEVLVSYILGIRNKEDFINIVLINCVTNPIINVLNIIISYKYIVLLEMLVIISEYIYYKKTLIFKKIKPIYLSIILNVCSYGIGFIIYLLILN